MNINSKGPEDENLGKSNEGAVVLTVDQGKELARQVVEMEVVMEMSQIKNGKKVIDACMRGSKRVKENENGYFSLEIIEAYRNIYELLNHTLYLPKIQQDLLKTIYELIIDFNTVLDGLEEKDSSTLEEMQGVFSKQLESYCEYEKRIAQDKGKMKIFRRQSEFSDEEIKDLERFGRSYLPICNAIELVIKESGLIEPNI